MSSKYEDEIFHDLHSVPRLEWTDPNALETMKKQLPVILTKTGLAGKALQKWGDLDYLAKHISASSKFRVYFSRGHFYTVTEKIKQRRRMFLKVKFERKV